MQNRTATQDRAQPTDAIESEATHSVVVEIGDAVELTEGTSSRSGSEDKRYKYR
ncbi:albusnodin family lasso peptide [Nocardiopsis sp. CT-R113]|uniref:Albusnodin family lasso peptide n=1 Tax=Nocardiopsis codii TaxID=3065942 RepID=A0ABU7K964_9ACTN|nr:albusnodin family lasso peptide [Nocardiopsis sp. CT-R113]MEE2038765.1 albusnodin family lasso peptide [Nocardiopsis sp. CT-R113]